MTTTFRSYLLGFVLSIVLTLAAYLFAAYSITLVIGLGVIQAIIQLILFLHLGKEPKWHLMTFLCMISILLILVLGSLWIMHNLHYRVG